MVGARVIRLYVTETLAARLTPPAALGLVFCAEPVASILLATQVLGEGLTDANGARHAMTGLLGHATSFAHRRLQLGYREARLLAGCPIGSARTRVRGHEFHYATLSSGAGDEPLAELSDGVHVLERLRDEQEDRFAREMLAHVIAERNLALRRRPAGTAA